MNSLYARQDINDFIVIQCLWCSEAEFRRGVREQ